MVDGSSTLMLRVAKFLDVYRDGALPENPLQAWTTSAFTLERDA